MDSGPSTKHHDPAPIKVRAPRLAGIQFSEDSVTNELRTLFLREVGRGFLVRPAGFLRGQFDDIPKARRIERILGIIRPALLHALLAEIDDARLSAQVEQV